MKKFFYILLFLTFSTNIFAQNQKILNAVFIENKPKIDGNLNDDAWKNIKFDNNFIQYEPYNKQNPSEKTYFKFAYDNNAIYIAAVCVSKNSKIFKILTKRDDFGQADYFGLYIDPYNTGITGYGFFVTAAGVQIDGKIDNTTVNYDWDAVWYSAVAVNDTGFTVEIKLPYSAFRFPKKENQSWHINFYRNIQQYREIDTWNYVDNSKTGILNQMGIIDNLNGINPPLRLAVMPHLSYYVQKYTGISQKGSTYSGGVDLKFGLNESFTVDMMLIPDFNQIQSDEQVINLSPYEIFYDEKRYFFTEGMEIFNKGDIFYSRRIGKVPSKYYEVDDLLYDNEIILKNPQATQIYNATKISGKTNKGFGIGFLNAFTGNTYAEILDTVTNRTRTILTEPFSNYNVMAINQPLKNNSYVSLTNTNFASFGRNYYADVTAQEAVLKNKKNSWSVFERVASSYIKNDTLPSEFGYAYKLSLNKTSGNFRAGIGRTLYSDKYNPNDLGYLKQNNIITNSLSVGYNIYKPFGKFLLWRNSIAFYQQRLFSGNEYIGEKITINSNTKLKNYTSIGSILTITPRETYDYFEPRTENRFYIKPPTQKITFWISTNYSKTFAYDILGEFYTNNLEAETPKGINFIFSPRLRLSNKALLVYSYNFKMDFNDAGYVSPVVSADSVFFGKRNIRSMTNTLNFDYIFTKNISTNLKIRHYWSIIDYFDYFILGDNGRLYPLTYSYRFISNNDLNYNAFTVDFIFKWIFMPGSEFSLAYKKQIFGSSSELIYNFCDNFTDMYSSYPILNSLSFKILFYLNSNTFSKNPYMQR